jgi:hypothetical protein
VFVQPDVSDGYWYDVIPDSASVEVGVRVKPPLVPGR